MKPRAYTEEEVREMFIKQCRVIAEHWATTDLTRPEFQIKTPEEDIAYRCSGVVHSIFAMLDGCSLGIPAIDLKLAPHPDDKAFHIKEGENWFEPGMMINDCQLHELLYRKDND